MATAPVVNSEDWRREKLDFICAVVEGVDRDATYGEISKCETEEEAEAIAQSLLLYVDRITASHIEKSDYICSVISGLDRAEVLAELQKCETEEEAGVICESLLLQQEELTPQALPEQTDGHEARQLVVGTDTEEVELPLTDGELNETEGDETSLNDEQTEPGVVGTRHRFIEITEREEAETSHSDAETESDSWETIQSDIEIETEQEASPSNHENSASTSQTQNEVVIDINSDSGSSVSIVDLASGSDSDGIAVAVVGESIPDVIYGEQSGLQEFENSQEVLGTAANGGIIDLHEVAESESEEVTGLQEHAASPYGAETLDFEALEDPEILRLREEYGEPDFLYAETEEMERIIAESKRELDTMIARRVDVVCNIFANADPEFLDEKIRRCTEIGHDTKKFEEYVEELLSITSYPTRKVYLETKKTTTLNKRKLPYDYPAFREEQSRKLPNDVSVACAICLEEKPMLSATSSCNAMLNEHSYCNSCIKRYILEEIGLGRSKFNCIEPSCSAEYSEKVLHKFLEPAVLANVLERRQHEEVIAAGIQHLECCPFCNFKAEILNPEDKVFSCQNPDCMVDSCRLCKEENHIPLRCEEVEKDPQKEARKRLETKMSEAIIRECPKCKNRFIKDRGCNHMTCPCGAHICYYCKNLMDSPQHINSPTCQQITDETLIHQQEVQAAARDGIRELDPRIKLVHDPTVGFL